MSDLQRFKKLFASEHVFKIGYLSGFKYYSRIPKVHEVSKAEYESILNGEY